MLGTADRLLRSGYYPEAIFRVQNVKFLLQFHQNESVFMQFWKSTISRMFELKKKLQHELRDLFKSVGPINNRNQLSLDSKSGPNQDRCRKQCNYFATILKACLLSDETKKI